MHLIRGAAMLANDSAHESDDVVLAGILFIAMLSMIIGVLMGFLIA